MALEIYRTAIYKEGQLTLEEPLALPDGARVEIAVRWEPDSEPDEDEAAIARETEQFVARHADLLAHYRGVYIAMKDGVVVDHDLDRLALYERVAATWGDTPVLVTPVREQPIQGFVIRSPRLDDD